MKTNMPTNWSNRDDAMLVDAMRRGATRRDLLKLLALSGIGAAAGGSLMLKASNAFAQTPKKGGHVRVAGWSSSTADTLDPAKASTAVDYIRSCCCYNRLSTLDENGQLQFELAESIKSDDAKTWTIKLKPGVHFHDGKALSSADVVYSLKRHLDPAVGSKVNGIAKQMSDVSAVDDQTVKVVLADPNADLPMILALHHFMVVANGTTDFSKGNGTGPFVLESFEPGVNSKHNRNPNYFKQDGPYIDSFELIAIVDDTARVNALLTGEIAIAGSINPRSVRLIEAQGGAFAHANNAGNYTDLNIRRDMDLGRNDDFVEGMKYLIDRETILKSALRGLGEVANDQPVPPINRYHNPNIKPRGYDPDRAKSLFQKAGVLGKKIPVIASDAATSSIDMATILQRSGATIGLDLDVQRVPSDGYWSNYWLKAPIHFGNINPRPTPDILFSLLYQSAAPWNESHYKSDKFDSMLVEARGMLDDKKRTEIYWALQEMVSNEAGTIIPAYIADIDGVSNKVKGWKSNPLGGLMGYTFAEHIWLEG
ncbi:ABC transporter substrate-binding protein [Mesorhizobium sp.]|uniref:ABC transporter substrate-binding protein n=1 Tax=Mesorhizobium sp. TaxID=1871066 RepID=UPI0025F1F5B2|nr:ABC transporter substrate-binding protein [Mesorhizobium sp.]